MHHSNISLDLFDQQLLNLLDGERSIEQLEELITQSVDLNDVSPETIKPRIAQSLYYFALNGLLENSDLATG